MVGSSRGGLEGPARLKPDVTINYQFTLLTIADNDTLADAAALAVEITIPMAMPM